MEFNFFIDWLICVLIVWLLKVFLLPTLCVWMCEFMLLFPLLPENRWVVSFVCSYNLFFSFFFYLAHFTNLTIIYHDLRFSILTSNNFILHSNFPISPRLPIFSLICLSSDWSISFSSTLSFTHIQIYLNRLAESIVPNQHIKTYGSKIPTTTTTRERRWRWEEQEKKKKHICQNSVYKLCISISLH